MESLPLNPSNTVSNVDILIVGSGPSGTATGITLAQRSPDLAKRTLCIDKTYHPREKICGGGLTGNMLQQLANLGISLDNLPSVNIDKCAAVYRSIRHEVELDPPFKVVRRDALDALLARKMVDEGVRLSEGESYVSHEPQEDGRILVTTSKARYAVKVLVAADGAGSKIARSLEPRRRVKVHLAQFDVPLPQGLDPSTMVYDFSAVTEELHGYLWLFPTPLYNEEGHQLVNVGLMQVGSTRLGGGMNKLLREGLSRYGIELGDARINFHPEWAFDPDYAFSAPNILTVGDAAGIDPLFGEGLHQCIEYGVMAAREIERAFKRDSFAFKGYRRRILWSAMGMEMRLLRIPAKRLYHPGNQLWTSFIFNGAYLAKMMAAQGQGEVQLHRRIVPIAGRALWHILAGNKNLPQV